MSEKKKPTMAEQALMEIEGNKPTMAEQAQMEFGGGDSSLPESREKTAIEGIKKFFSDAVDPQAYYEAGRRWGNPLVKGTTKELYFGIDDEIVGAIAGDKEKARYKADQDEAEKTNPGLFLTGEMLGGLATPAGAITALKNVPGLAKLATKSPKLAKTLAGMIAGGTQGGIAGAGYAEDDVADSAGYGAAFGAAIPGIAGGVGKLASYAPKRSTIFKKLFGLSDLEYDTAKNLDLDTAKTPEQMQSFYQDILNGLQKNTAEAGDAVKSRMTTFDELATTPGVGVSTDGVVPFFGAHRPVEQPAGTLTRGDIATALQSLIKGDDKFPGLADLRPKTGKYEFKNPETERILGRVQKQVNQSLKGMDEYIPEDRVFGLVDELTNSINYNKDSNLKQKIVKGLASRIKEQVYERNPLLKDSKMLAQDAMGLEDLGKKILSPSTEWEGSEKFFLPSDTTKKAESRLLNPESFETKRFSDKLKEATGLDLESEALKRYVKESTSGGAPTSFYDRKGVDLATSLVAPIGVGAYTASQYGAGEGIGIGALGLGLGIARDKFGKRVGRNILQKLRTIPKEVDPMDYGSPTAAQLQKMAVDMATGGNKRLAATYYVLSQRNENLRKKKDE